MVLRSSISLLLVFLCFSFSLGQIITGVPYTKYGIYDIDQIRPEEYSQRRSVLMAKMSPNSIAIFRAKDYSNRSGDVNYRFRQNSNFLYFTGCNEANSTLVLIPGGVVLDNGSVIKEILFLSPKTKDWTGENLGTEGALEILGFGSAGSRSIALSNDRLKDILPTILSNGRILYYTPSLPEELVDPISDIHYIGWRESMKNLQEKYPNLEVKAISMIVGDMRTVKSPAEIELLQKAADATIAAQIEAMKSCEPGMFEYQLQAVAEYCFTREGAEYTGFPSAIGSGPNTQFHHYNANRRKMLSGELVIMDIGAEYHGYSADITRTIPVNGTFTSAQKEIYDLVLHAEQAAIDTISPGVMAADIETTAIKIMTEGLIRLRIAKDSTDAEKYCPHKVSHFIGLNVHDGVVMGKLIPGMVMTVEPGIYIPEGSDCPQKYWNIGIRIEDDVAVTDEGRSVLSAFAPQTVSDIESLMKKRGIGNQKVGTE